MGVADEDQTRRRVDGGARPTPREAPLRRPARPDHAARASRGLPAVARPTWRQRLDGSDPGSVRLVMSVRAVLNLAAVLAVMAGVAAALGLSGTPRTVVLILGCVLAMITTFTASDPTPRGRMVTTLCLPVAMLVTITLSTLVDKHRVTSLVVFVVVMVVVVWARRFGPRAFACGMVAWIGYFMALFLQLSITQVPLVLAALAASLVALLIINGLLVPQSPARRLRRMVDALLARVHIARWDAVLGRHAPEPDEHALAIAMLRTNEVAVLVDGQLAVPGALRDPAAAPLVRASVLRVELALAALLEAEVAAADEEHPTDGAADAAATAARELDDALDRLATVMDDDRAGRPASTTVTDQVEAAFTPGADLFAGFLPGSAVTVGAMFDPADDTDGADGSQGPDRPRSTEVARVEDERRGRPRWRLDRLSLTTRQAVQIGVASALAIVLGDVISGQRWYWAVLACFLAFTGTATSAEATRKAGQRSVGTVVGVIIAMPLLPLLGHGVAVGLLTMFVALFVGFYFFRVSYTVLAISVTVLVAELYELMGTFSQQILWLRIGETVLGAVIGGIVALCVLPTPARDAESAARAQLAEDLRDALDDVATRIRRGRTPTSAADLHQRLRLLDGHVHQLAVIGLPMLRREVPGTRVPRAIVRRRLAGWATAAIRVRGVVHAVEDAPAGAVPGHPQVARAIASVHALAEGTVLVGGTVPSEPAPDGPSGEDGARGGGGAAVTPTGPDVDRLRELAALHGALVALQEIDGVTGSGPDAASGDGAAVPSSRPPATAGGSPWRLVGSARGVHGAADVVVTLIDANGRQHGRARAAGGHYELLLPGPGTWQLVLGARGHAPRADRVVVPANVGDGPHVVRHDVTLDAAREVADPLLVGHRGPPTAPV